MTRNGDRCTAVRKWLEPFSRGEVPEPEAEKIRAHLRRCLACEDRLSEYVVAGVLSKRPEMLEVREERSWALAWAASFSEASSESLKMEELIDEWRERFGRVVADTREFGS